jgi:hypothetical protein
MISWITSPAVKLDSFSWASGLLLAPAYMIRPSPVAPISERNVDHFAAASSWLPPRDCALPIRA